MLFSPFIFRIVYRRLVSYKNSIDIALVPFHKSGLQSVYTKCKPLGLFFYVLFFHKVIRVYPYKPENLQAMPVEN